MKKLLPILFATIAIHSFGQEKWSEEMAKTAMKLWPDTVKTGKWSYDQGVVLKGIERVWNASGDPQYFRYIQHYMDMYVQDDGQITGYKPEDYNIDNVNNGKNLLLLYRVLGKEKYKKAADLLRKQLQTQPRTSDGGFWHKKIYPSQMWLDGLHMGEPFYAEYAMLFHEDTAFNDIARQFILMEKHARDPKTNLLYHGWDESKQQQWANKTTGQSPNFWARSLGWYGMALVDALDYFPVDHPKHKELLTILARFAAAIQKVQDSKTGLWYDVPDKQKEPGNYLESSASCMLAYTLAKGARKQWLPAIYMTYAKKAYAGIIKNFIEKDANGQVNLKGTVAVSGLGGNPYRDGSFNYYIKEPVVTNDPKGVGAFIQCAAEMEFNATQSAGKGKIVLLDYYFNNEWKKDATGRMTRYHYTWEDKASSGYSMLGDVFNRYGAITRSLATAPTAQNLAPASVYIIVDPDTDKETEKPNYVGATDIKAISNWVKAGGVLVLLSNNAGNAEFTHFNELAVAFSIHFNEDNQLMVQNDTYPQGEVKVPADHLIFKTAKNLYVKEISSISVKSPAQIILTRDTLNVMAVSHYGKGTVFALGDPWIYNEYLDGRKLPLQYENYKAANDWVQWLIKQTVIKK